MPESPPNYAAWTKKQLHDRYVKLEDRIVQEKAGIAYLSNHGDARRIRTREAVIDRLDDELTQIHGILYPIFINGDERLSTPQCDYCGPEFRFKDEAEAYRRGNVCYRCDPNHPGTPEDHPGWSPLYDDPASPTYRNRRHADE